ncbi:MAG: low molecular weight protein-tyrosine-phosphatase [Lysobacteraceae bacterium]
MKNILFVCLGNICRSPLAEALTRTAAQRVGLDLHLDSAGTADYHVGRAPDPRSRAVARRRGVPIDDLRARQVQAADFARFDLILAADGNNLRDLQALAQRAQGSAQLALLLDWSGVETGGDVPDPYYGDEAGFEAVHDLLERAAAALVERLRTNHA